VVDGTSANPHQNLSRLQHGVRDIAIPNYAQFTMFKKVESLHGITP